MYLHLLEIMYAVADRESVETWLSQAQLGGVIISTEQYGEEIVTVLASEQPLVQAHQQAQHHLAISDCEGKRCAVYRVRTRTVPDHVLCAFPFRQGEEWFLGPGNQVYLCVQSHHLSDTQIAWLAANTAIAEWSGLFDLVPVLVGG